MNYLDPETKEILTLIKKSKATAETLEAFDQQNLFPAYRLAYTKKHDESGVATFQPRLPRYPLDGEDSFTPRVSWSPSVVGCNRAISVEAVMFLYGLTDTGLIVKCKTIEQIISTKKTLFNLILKQLRDKAVANELPPWEKRRFLKLYRDYRNDPSWGFARDNLFEFIVSFTDFPDDSLSKNCKKLILGCVPDCDETGEVWTIKPTRAKFLGYVILSDTEEGDVGNLRVYLVK